MHLIIGLGNPGRRYERTRHNVGFEVLDEIARQQRLSFRPGKGEYEFANCSLNDRPVILAKPVTYMNESGIAAQEMIEHFEVSLADTLVVVDDFQIPLGSLRLRPGGSDGGHNGLASVIYHVQSDEFPRLRCGIGSEQLPADRSLTVDFVLDRFAPSEESAVRAMIQRAGDACISFVVEGLAKTMSVFNQKQTDS